MKGGRGSSGPEENERKKEARARKREETHGAARLPVARRPEGVWVSGEGRRGEGVLAGAGGFGS